MGDHVGAPHVYIDVWRSFYQDSMVLMQVAAHLRALPGIREAAALMGTPANHAVLESANLATPESAAAAPGDLVLAVDATDDAAAQAAFAAAKAFFENRQSARASTGRAQPRTIEAALRDASDATLALVSVPGAYATLEAGTALRRGLHVFLFSDNVPVDDEIALKTLARERGLFCMGPDCGTAYVRGVGLGFANVVPRGRIGCVAASGTGLQAVASRIAALGEGVSHAIGVGGRDISAAVGGVMTTSALDALAADAETDVVVVISKPPAPEVLPALIAALSGVGKPVVVCALGATAPPGAPGIWVSTLEDAADAAVSALRGQAWTPRAFTDADAVRARLDAIARDGAKRGGRLLGLYTGGTLAEEARLLLGTVPHQILDLGADEFTVGRPHPMIDPAPRDDRVRAAGASRDVGVVLVDLVLGRAAHADPARSLSAAIRDARAAAARDGRTLTVVASVVGTEADPQGLSVQIDQLIDAGAELLSSNAQAARFAAAILGAELATPTPPRAVDIPRGRGRSAGTHSLLDRPLVAINVGLELFAHELEGTDVGVLHVDWRPPAGDADIAALLARFDD